MAKIEGRCTKSLVLELLINPGCRKRYQMNALTLYYDPGVWHKKNLIFHFMNFNENLRNLRERKKIKISIK